MPKYFFESDKSDNFLELVHDDKNNVWIEKHYVDGNSYESILEFCKMVADAFESMIEKGAEHYNQYTNKIEWENNLNKDDRWDLIQQFDNNVVLIQCDINDAAGCIIESFMEDPNIEN
jgi:hypothetical protein